MNKAIIAYHQTRSVEAGNNYEQLHNEEMKKGLLSASMKPTRESDIRSFRILHSPRVHKMAEWLLQYEHVCRREKQYLQQFKELRQQFQSHDNEELSIPKYGEIFWKPSRALLTKSNDRTSRITCVLYPQKKRVINHVNRDGHLKNSDISQQKDAESSKIPMSINASTFFVNKPRYVSQHLGIDRNKTDYEPIEFIAKRNKLSFSRYFR